MIDTITAWFNAVMEWVGALPVQGWAILIGILLGGAVTQWLKRTIPIAILWPSLTKPMQVMVLRCIALVCAFIPTYILWPDDQYEVWAAVSVGFATPVIYRVATVFLYKRFPLLKAKLSGTE